MWMVIKTVIWCISYIFIWYIYYVFPRFEIHSKNQSLNAVILAIESSPESPGKRLKTRPTEQQLRQIERRKWTQFQLWPMAETGEEREQWELVFPLLVLILFHFLLQLLILLIGSERDYFPKTQLRPPFISQMIGHRLSTLISMRAKPFIESGSLHWRDKKR